MANFVVRHEPMAAKLRLPYRNELVDVRTCGRNCTADCFTYGKLAGNPGGDGESAEGDDDARRAIQVFAHRVRKYIGAYAAVMGGVDAIVFTGGIGQHSALMRHRIAQRLGSLQPVG